MADINFGILDTQMPGRIAAIPQQAQAQQAQNALQLMQFQHSMGQNELAKYQLSAAQRADQTQNAISRAYQESIGPDGTLDYTKLQSRLAAGGAGSSIPELQNKRLTAENLAARTEASKATTKKTNYELTTQQIDRARSTIAAARNPEEALVAISKSQAAGDIDAADADLLRKKLGDGATFAEEQKNMNLAMLSAKDRLAQTTISAGEQARLDQSKFQFENPSAYQQLQLDQSKKQHLENLAQQGWTFDTERGIAVNARQGISRPISTLMAPVGGAPVTGAAPFVGNGAPTGGVPGQRQAPAGATSAGPSVLGPKPEKLNESQGNATAFGLRMKESNAILERLAKEGVLRGANVESIPFVGGATGKLLPSTLGGTNEKQQQVNQAKSNFITAVLRKESGAVISDSEFSREDEKYFPQLNDSPKVIQQKSNARKLAIEAMKFQAGAGAKEIDKYVPTVNAETSSLNLSEPPPGAVRPRGNR